METKAIITLEPVCRVRLLDLSPAQANKLLNRMFVTGAHPHVRVEQTGGLADIMLQVVIDDVTPAPIPMRLHCPACKTLHIDDGHFATRPHHTHACQVCGMVWRPALVATVGVRFLPGFKNEVTNVP